MSYPCPARRPERRGAPLLTPYAVGWLCLAASAGLMVLLYLVRWPAP